MYRWKSLLPAGSMVIFAFNGPLPIEELSQIPEVRQERRIGTFTIWFGVDSNSIPRHSVLNSQFCNGGTIKLPNHTTSSDELPINEIVLDPIQMWNIKKPSSLSDYLSICYNLKSVDTDWKNSCYYGVEDNEGRCLCIEGFYGSRCQSSILFQLNCDDGYASYNNKNEPICYCNSPVGGLQYCGFDPCNGSCIGECSKWKDGIKCDASSSTSSTTVGTNSKEGSNTMTSSNKPSNAPLEVTSTESTMTQATIFLTDETTATISEPISLDFERKKNDIDTRDETVETTTVEIGATSKTNIHTTSSSTTTTVGTTVATTDGIIVHSSQLGRQLEPAAIETEITRIEECGKHGRRSGNSCICFDGYRGIQCQIPPIDLVCEKDKIQVKLSNEYNKYMEHYYLPNGTFFICQSEKLCTQKICPIKQNFNHTWSECGSILTRKYRIK